jgi:dephospho-CoA kinase
MKPKIIGLTGGIGSGKTTIANYFASLGVPVYIADEEAKKILYTPQAVQEVKDAFGPTVFTDSLPDRKKLAAAVFSDKEKLALLNAIIHPKVSAHFKDWVAAHAGHRFIIKEAAILFESGSYRDCDSIILVTAPPDVRMARVMLRDKVEAENVQARMENQWSDDDKKRLSDYVIVNENLETAKKQADMIYNALDTAD